MHVYKLKKTNHKPPPKNNLNSSNILKWYNFQTFNGVINIHIKYY